MTTWVLIVWGLCGYASENRACAITNVPGYTKKETCDAAAAAMAPLIARCVPGPEKPT